MLRLGTLIPQGSSGVFYAQGVSLLMSNTCGVLLVLSVDITHTNKDTQHIGASRLAHPYKYILTPPVMCLQ